MKPARLRSVVLVGWCVLIGILPTLAQDNTILSLQADSATVETGQYYPITVYLQDVTDLWQINAEIEYDPSLLYVIGTVTGSPFTIGDFFADQPDIVIRNEITAGRIIFTQSLVAPAIPQSGSDIVATFQIYPLSAGSTQIRFTAADLTKVNFIEGTNGSRTVGNSEALPVLPALIDLTITGDTVAPPDESTPTPAPSETPDLARQGDVATVVPTLVNITLAPPDAIPTLIPELDDSGDSGSLPTLPIAIGLLAIGILGGIGLFIMSRRR